MLIIEFKLLFSKAAKQIITQDGRSKMAAV